MRQLAKQSVEVFQGGDVCAARQKRINEVCKGGAVTTVECTKAAAESITAICPHRLEYDEPVVLPSRFPNLLVNGDFEQGFAAARSVEHGTNGARGPWSFQFSPGVHSYIYAESGYDWRKPCVM